MTNIQADLFKLRDEKYAAFQANLTPGVDVDSIIGVRVPALRAYAKEIADTSEARSFLNELPHRYYDENMLHGILLSNMKAEYDVVLKYVEEFLPYMDNWAVCDTTIPKVFAKNREQLIDKIYEWSGSEKVYTCRFGIKMLMSHFLKEDYKNEYLELPAGIQSEEYYVNMMLAWFYATALAYQYEDTVKYIEQNRLPKWVHNKTIQKAVESYRITDEQKTYLKSFRIKNTGTGNE